MYVTRPLSLYKKNPQLLNLPPPEGPNSGYLVLQDDEESQLWELPFPQNKLLTVYYRPTVRDTASSELTNGCFFIPVINQPLSSNQYYAIKAEGDHKGEAHGSILKADEKRCLCCIPLPYVPLEKLQPPNPDDIYQQFRFISISTTPTRTTTTHRKTNMFIAESVAQNAKLPVFLRIEEGFHLKSTTPHFILPEASGLDSALRNSFPDFNFPLSCSSSPSISVGKWYTPFVFVKERMTLAQQMERSMFYEITLEQRWERIFTTENIKDHNKGSSIQTTGDDMMNVVVPTKVIRVSGIKDVVDDELSVVDGVMWFKSKDGGERVGVNMLVVERMIWEEERVGWINDTSDDKKQAVAMPRVDCETKMWKKFGCYVLIERFIVKRLDGSLVLTYDFYHSHQIRTKLELVS